MKLTELSEKPAGIHRKFWIEELKLPLEWVDATDEEKQNAPDMLVSKLYDAVLLSSEYSEMILPKSPRIPAEIVEAGYADSLVCQDGKMWPRCYFREALRQLILQISPRLDTHATCYVTGADAISRACAVIAIQLGFRDFVIISPEAERSANLVESLKKLFFGLKIQILGETELTLQPNNGSLLLNTLTAETGPVILEDLTYLNFLKKDGLVVDVPLDLQKNTLIEEADHTGVRYLTGVDIWGHRDYLFLSAILKDLMPLSLEKYLDQWKKFASQENET